MQDRFGLVPARLRAEIENEEAVDRQVGAARWLDKELKARDPYLGLVFVKPDIPEWELPMGAVAGRWHVERKNPGFVSTYVPIQGPKGEFREPTADIFDMLDRIDLRKDEVFREVLRRGERKREEQRKATELQDEQRRDELVSDFKAAKRVAGEGGLTKRKWDRGKK